MGKTAKSNVEIELVKVEFAGLAERHLPVSRHLVSVDLVWPRTGVAKKSAARQVNLDHGEADCGGEPWAKRILFREEIEGHCGIAVALTEPLSVQKVRKYLKLVAKAALKEGADLVSGACAGYGEIAAAPVDALAAMVGSSEAPKTVAQGLIDFDEFPSPGGKSLVAIPLERPLTHRAAGTVTLLVHNPLAS